MKKNVKRKLNKKGLLTIKKRQRKKKRKKEKKERRSISANTKKK